MRPLARNYLQLREVSERLYILVGAGTVERAVAKEVLAQEDVIKTATFGAPALESDLYILRPLADTERDVARLVCSTFTATGHVRQRCSV